LHKFIEWEDVSDNLQEYLIISSGITSEDRSKLTEAVYRYPNIPFLCLDVANGYTQHFFKAIEKTREMFPDHILIAGNVATPEAAEQVILSGADIVKVGIGPGKACSTRFVTGVGYPQLSAVIETADAVHGLSGHIIADGGCKTPGDVAKAFCAGADFVMLGYLFAGHDETGQDFYGMSSAKAQTKYYGEVKEYRASEGLELQITSRGPLRDTIQQILGGLRSCCSYIGASEIKHMPKCATLVRVNRIK
jgi:GMP reductase